MPSPLRVLVIGADGTIGSALSRHLLDLGHNVFKTTRRKLANTSAYSIFLDLAEPVAETERLPDVDVAIICAAMARFADCRTRPDLARQVNVISTSSLARRLTNRGTFVVRLSSSAVFDCLSPHALADQQTAPRSIYGRLQADAEAALLGFGSSSTVLRLTKILTPQSSLFKDWVCHLLQGRSIEAFTDHTLCPLPLAAAVDAATAVLSSRQRGIFQISGSRDISYANLARHLALRLNVPVARVTPVRAVERGIPENEVTPFTSMDTTRLTALTGFIRPEPLAVMDDVLDELLAKANYQKAKMKQS
jgi:dTDP-4-dehydrorhamnose reductase